MSKRVTTVETYDWDAKSKKWVAKSKTVTEVIDQATQPIVLQPYVPPYYPYPRPYQPVWSSTMTADAAKYTLNSSGSITAGSVR